MFLLEVEASGGKDTEVNSLEAASGPRKASWTRSSSRVWRRPSSSSPSMLNSMLESMVAVLVQDSSSMLFESKIETLIKSSKSSASAGAGGSRLDDSAWGESKRDDSRGESKCDDLKNESLPKTD